MSWIDIPSIIAFYHSPVVLGVFALVGLIGGISFLSHSFPNAQISILFEVLYVKLSNFYIEILGKDTQKWVLCYILSLFFIILFSNTFGLFLELLSPFFGFNEHGDFLLEEHIVPPTSDINFNLAMAIVSIGVLLLSLQKNKGFIHVLNEFFPIFGKGYVTVGPSYKGKWYYYPAVIVSKVFDIILSLLIGLLDIVGLGAKVVSLSFRLFGNIASETILLAIVVGALSYATEQMLGFSFPVVIPLFVYFLGILVAVVQAFVFTLLLSVSIKVMKLTS